MKRVLFLNLLLSLSSLALFGQSFQIMRFGIADGLCHESTYTISQDPDGFLWVGTAEGLCRYDGKSFTSNFTGDVLPASIVHASFVDSKGKSWFGYMDGMISCFSDNHFKVFEPEGDSKSIIAGFVEDESGNILAMTQQSGLIIIKPDMSMIYDLKSFSGKAISTFFLMGDGLLMIGGFDGLSIYSSEKGSSRYVDVGRIPGLPYTRIQTIQAGLEDDTYWIGTEDEGLYYVNGKGDNPENYTAVKAGEDQGLKYSSINTVFAGDPGYVWVSDYGIGVYRFQTGEDGSLSNRLFFNEKSGLPEVYIKEIFQDDEGNVWFASQSSGIAVLRDQAFTFYDFEQDTEVPAISSISMIDDNYWYGSEGLLIWVDGSNSDNRRFYVSSSGVPSDKITALFQDESQNLFIGTEYSGVYILKKGLRHLSPFFIANNSLGKSINGIVASEEATWVATNNGVYSVDLKDGSIENQSTNTGLPHNIINDVLVDRNGEVWIATKSSGIQCITNEELSYSIQGDPKLEFVDMIEDDAGNIWAATKEDGVFKFDQDSIAVFNEENGLKAKYTYAVGVDPNGFIWVGHRLGLSRIDPESKNIAVFGPETGFTSDILYRAIDVNDEGLMLFGTNNGIITYDSHKARIDSISPRLSIVELNISDSLYNASSDIKLPYGAYKVRIDFVGINLSNPDQVTYQYKLDGFDIDWSDPARETFARYPRLEDGQYTFLLKACDGNGNCSEVSLLHISVKIPIWKAWWFIVSVVVLAIVSVFMIIKIREQKQKALQEYLEQQLDERTREVVHQKEEIEIKNRDITDSINYAQRIQASILPPIKKLHNTFSGSFVFYQPRDIVSGDFYWYDKFDEDRFIIVCADSTGHGVPGAFMSMIGTTLIKDICLRPGINRPSDVLKTLDYEVREALNQNRETDGSNDGMDIIVAEFNLKTNMFSVSSAMRPIILYVNGEQIYVKGSRSSVGGQLEDDHSGKEFANQQFQLSKGDTIYMFSDGYPDQFGGPLGRKFKMVRLKNLLRDIHDKPMDEQYNYIKSNFFLWKEDLEQVDDVLFMGVKI